MTTSTSTPPVAHRPIEPLQAGRASVAATIAATLGALHASLSALWLAGSTVLLETVGGEIERWGRQRSASTLVALATITVTKAVVAGSALAFAHIGARRLPNALYRQANRPTGRALGWTSAIVLTAYGTILTAIGLLVQLGAIDAASDADRRALAWHAYVWDPWFACWGVALAATLLWTRPPSQTT